MVVRLRIRDHWRSYNIIHDTGPFKIRCDQSPVNVLKRELLTKRFCTQFIGKSIPNMEQGQLLNVGYLLPGCT
ncbi:hypothetical protein WN944_017091 [Citrus x changshan-huyou]|uniref:Uncharacterized protein n=1 Tax=Citrus x changshan-huyou TaxID=2935761 RepID=A0AAP0MD64_9ROSI